MRGLTIQNRVFYEWKQKKNIGWAPSRDPTATILAPWLSATPCSMYEKKKTSKSLSLPELELFQEFTIPLENLQFHWKYVSLWEGFSEHCGLSPFRGPSAGAISSVQPALCVESGEASANFERPSRSHFSLDSRQQAILV